MSAEQFKPEAQQLGSVEINGREIGVYADESQLPSNVQKRMICEVHIDEGKAADLYNDFVMMGCHSPGKDQDPIIIIRFACKGLGLFRKHCRLTLTQYDTERKALTKGTFEG